MNSYINKNPTFTIYTGPMFGSKTTRLLAEVDRLRYKKRSVLLVKPSIDVRYDTNKITTHSGITFEAICVSSADDLYEYIRHHDFFDTIAVDEAFMIKGIDAALIDYYRRGMSIIVSSIQLDAKEQPFESIRNMMPWATKIEICSAVCTQCDDDAYFTEAMFDMDNTTQEERIGAGEKYQPRCAKHYTTFKG